jgi:dolichol-phosphate mannosyltransferase/undecaprenyl-phosphate 4-deoxy-4-formamido-L-arabinose transferase
MTAGRTADIDISVVVPTYKGGQSLPELVQRTETFFLERELRGEIVIVNDASPDGSWSVVQRLAAAHPTVVGIDLLTNHGQARATLCGIAHARGELVATMDDDLQQWPEDLGRLYDALAEHPEWDAAIGTWGRDQPSLAKRLGSWVHAAVDQYAQGTPKGFRHTSFRMMRRPLADALCEHDTRTPVLGPLVRQLSSEVHNVEVRHSPRSVGSSTITLRESIDRVVTNIIHGTTLPLRILSRLGVFAAVVSALLSAVLFINWIFGAHHSPGWASVFLATTFFGGMCLIGIATIGRYLSVVLEETRGSPKWAVRRVVLAESVPAEVPFTGPRPIEDRAADTA